MSTENIERARGSYNFWKQLTDLINLVSREETKLKMAKFIKSIFSSSDRKSRLEGQDGNNDFAPPLDGRRNLSISRSGRMKQSNKKRNSLSVIIQDEDQFQPVEKPTSIEYHVNAPVLPATKDASENKEKIRRKTSTNTKSPEEEIDIAFDIIDKT